MTKTTAANLLRAQDSRFVALVREWSTSGLPLERYSEMLRLGRSYGKRHGMSRDDAIDQFAVRANRPHPFD